MLADAATGATRIVLHEEDPQWINVLGEPRFLGKGERFLWTSERSGFRHLYLYGIDGTLQKQLTSGDWEITSIDGVEEDRQCVVFTSSEAGPVERQLYSVSFDGANKQRLTRASGTHAVSLAPKSGYYVDDFSSLSTPPRRSLYKSDGTEVREIRIADKKTAEEFDILPAEIVKVKAADGTLLYARLVKPAGFEPGKKYPAVVIVYGGPGVQEVRDRWSGLSWEQVLAHKGFVVWQIDNRGSMGRAAISLSP